MVTGDPPRFRRVTPGALIGVLVLLAAAACGRKAPPFLTARVPLSVFADARVLPFRGGALVVWTEMDPLPAAPKEREWSAYRVRRRAGDGRMVEVGTVPRGAMGGLSYRYADFPAGLDPPPAYQVVLTTTDGRSEVATGELILDPSPAPPPPRMEEPRAGDGQVALGWSVPGEVGIGVPTGFLVFRRLGEGEFDRTRPLTPAPVAESGYLDARLDNGKRYCYAVASVAPVGGDRLEGPLSPAVCASPRDTTPPAAPRGLAIARSAGALLLTWEENGERDLAGYRVYRRGGEEEFGRVGPPLVKVPLFRDQDPPGEGPLRYTVTALDGAEPPNESPFAGWVEAPWP
jgi:hypothetical protein